VHLTYGAEPSPQARLLRKRTTPASRLPHLPPGLPARRKRDARSDPFRDARHVRVASLRSLTR
jgi:hypothetical protein